MLIAMKTAQMGCLVCESVAHVAGEEVAEAYDPLDYDNLARSVVYALLERSPEPLSPPGSFGGSGVYALYYTGSLPFYAHIASTELNTPIYVGKAVPTGARKGSALASRESGPELQRRLREHTKSIEQAENLALDEFQCRYLVVVPVWITLAERFLIDHFRPLWNTLIDGFGNHPPGSGRQGMRRPRWDIVHPGRPWATRLRAAETAYDIVRLIETTDT
jgi:hypothetical protein